MNVDNIKLLIKRLRAPATQGHFSMSTYMSPTDRSAPVGKDIHNCGTTAGIAGYAYILARPDATNDDIRTGSVRAVAIDFLEIDPRLASQLFDPGGDVITYADVTPETAAGVLEKLLETGIVSWPDEVRV